MQSVYSGNLFALDSCNQNYLPSPYQLEFRFYSMSIYFFRCSWWSNYENAVNTVLTIYLFHWYLHILIRNATNSDYKRFKPYLDTLMLSKASFILYDLLQTMYAISFWHRCGRIRAHFSWEKASNKAHCFSPIPPKIFNKIQVCRLEWPF